MKVTEDMPGPTSHRRMPRLLAGVFLLLLGSCGPEAPLPVEEPKDRPLPPFPASEAKGVVSGRILYIGPPFEPEFWNVGVEPVCEAHHRKRGGLLKEDFRLGKEGGIPFAFVWVPGLEKRWTFEVPDEPVEIRQVNCEYQPHVVGVMRGQALHVTSQDPCEHNVRWKSRSLRVRRPNISQRKGSRSEYRLRRSGDGTFVCDIHRWMSCEVRVRPHPVFGVSGGDGGFRLPPLPDGAYEIEVSHPAYGSRSLEVEIRGGRVEPLEILFDTFKG